jgi:hypothetical protein
VIESSEKRDGMKIVDIATRRIRLSAGLWFAPRTVPAGTVPFFEFP